MKNGLSYRVTKHALTWLVLGNLIGIVLAYLLIHPAAGHLLGEITYGKILPLHLNIMLYGWTSIPCIAWLFYLYQAEESYARYALLAWSTALFCGCISWLLGITSGKIFLDWKGAALMIFLLAQMLLWLTLWRGCVKNIKPSRAVKWIKYTGVIFLLAVPVSMWIAASPATYPPVDRSTGGPQGASLLGSTLVVVALMLLVPRSILQKENHYSAKKEKCIVLLLVMELLAFLILEKIGGTHRELSQILGLGLLLPWVILVPMYWRDFLWPPESASWRNACLSWWALLVITGWLEFLPNVLDRMKFTSGLVAHAHLAMAGFTTSFCMLLLTCLNDASVAKQLRKHAAWWHAATACYVLVMMWCGWCEGGNYEWMSGGASWRQTAFVLRLLCGIVMFFVSVKWWLSVNLLENQSDESETKIR